MIGIDEVLFRSMFYIPQSFSIVGSFFNESEGVKSRIKEIEVPSIPAADDITACCGLCQEKFAKFFDQEQEEWMYRDAIRVNQQLYHSTCYRDIADNVGNTH